MEALNLEQILVQPIFDELKINLRSFAEAKVLEESEIVGSHLQIAYIKKNQGEQNNEKGS